MKSTRRFYGFLLFALLCSSTIFAAPPGGGPPPPAGPPIPVGFPFHFNTQALFALFVIGYSFYLIAKLNKRSVNRS